MPVQLTNEILTRLRNNDQNLIELDVSNQRPITLLTIQQLSEILRVNTVLKELDLGQCAEKPKKNHDFF